MSFIETDDVHMGRNEDPFMPVELYVTYTNPPGSTLRSEADDPGCGFDYPTHLGCWTDGCVRSARSASFPGRDEVVSSSAGSGDRRA